MAKLDWERPKFSWERVTNDDHLFTSETRAASPQMRRVIVTSTEAQIRKAKV